MRLDVGGVHEGGGRRSGPGSSSGVSFGPCRGKREGRTVSLGKRIAMWGKMIRPVLWLAATPRPIRWCVVPPGHAKASDRRGWSGGRCDLAAGAAGDGRRAVCGCRAAAGRICANRQSATGEIAKARTVSGTTACYLNSHENAEVFKINSMDAATRSSSRWRGTLQVLRLLPQPTNVPGGTQSRQSTRVSLCTPDKHIRSLIDSRFAIRDSRFAIRLE
ncbi:hypothetical protein MLGJGCBP_07674 [Rhodococcus sp. T7]|nr:hypothetical protein MLGJGCBP_07674 [Rhodococcus sp. T7]